MIYQKLEDYLNALAWLYCTDSDVRAEIDPSGLKFSTLPDCLGTEIAKKAQAISSFDLATHDLKSDLAILERIASPSLVPTDLHAAFDRLKELLATQNVFELCTLGTRSPDLALQKILEFQTEISTSVESRDLATLMKAELSVWEDRVNNNTNCLVIPMFEKLSAMIGGFNAGRVAILLADTGFGKTNLGLTLALSARHDLGSAYVNMEMGFDDIAKRIAVLESGIPYSEFYKRVRDPSFHELFSDNGKAFFVTSGRTLTPNQIKLWLRRLKQESEIGFVVVDYDQCLELDTSREMPEWRAIKLVLDDFDNFAKEIGAFVLILAQLNRDGEMSSSHRALFKAHTVLHFRDDDTFGPIIHAKKNRHGKKDQALQVLYNEESSRITEMNVITLSSKKEKREFKAHQQTQTQKQFTGDWR